MQFYEDFQRQSIKVKVITYAGLVITLLYIIFF